jgi:hypothetical protein
MFEGGMDADAFKKWLNLIEGYFSFQKKFNIENITFALLKPISHVKYWWENYLEKYSTEESEMFVAEPTWRFFMDVIKEQYYPVGNYDDRYMTWTTLYQERGQIMLEFTNTFHTLRFKLGIKDFE